MKKEKDFYKNANIKGSRDETPPKRNKSSRLSHLILAGLQGVASFLNHDTPAGNVITPKEGRRYSSVSPVHEKAIHKEKLSTETVEALEILRQNGVAEVSILGYDHKRREKITLKLKPQEVVACGILDLSYGEVVRFNFDFSNQKYHDFQKKAARYLGWELVDRYSNLVKIGPSLENFYIEYKPLKQLSQNPNVKKRVIRLDLNRPVELFNGKMPDAVEFFSVPVYHKIPYKLLRDSDASIFSRSDFTLSKDECKTILTGVGEAEALFGLHPGKVIKNIIVQESQRVNAYFYTSTKRVEIAQALIQTSRSTRISHSQILLLISRHEGLHGIQSHFDIYDKQWQAYYDSLHLNLSGKEELSQESKTLNRLDEGYFFGLLLPIGHAFDRNNPDQGELFTTLVNGLVASDKSWEGAVGKMTHDVRHSYLTTLKELRGLLNRHITEESLKQMPIYSILNKRIEYLER